MTLRLCAQTVEGRRVFMRRGIKTNVLKRVNANRQKAADVQEREEREAEMIRSLNQKKEQTKS